MPDYFQGFNYSLANEDTRVERKEALRASSILTVCGSGARVIPLLHGNLATIHVVDVSEIQLNFLNLKRLLIRQLDQHDYLRFLGYEKADRSFREKILRELNPDSTSRGLAEQELALEKGLIYCGRWETHLLRMSERIRNALGFRFEPFFETRDLDEQRELFSRIWPKWRLRLLLFLFANRSSLNRQVYEGRFPHEARESLSNFLRRNFEFFFSERPARSSFFHQLLFLGELRYAEGFPLEAHAETLQSFREFKGDWVLHHRDLNESIHRHGADFLSLSDVPTYLGENQLRDLQDGLSRRFQEGTKAALIRTFLHHPLLRPRACRMETLSPWLDSTGLYHLHSYQGAP